MAVIEQSGVIYGRSYTHIVTDDNTGKIVAYSRTPGNTRNENEKILDGTRSVMQNILNRINSGH